MDGMWTSRKYNAKTRRIEGSQLKKSNQTPAAERASSAALQDRFMAAMKNEKATLDVYLKNESIRRGRLLDYDNWTILLYADEKYYLLFKSAIMSIIPLQEVMIEGIPQPDKSPLPAYAERVADGGHEPYYYHSALY